MIAAGAALVVELVQRLLQAARTTSSSSNVPWTKRMPSFSRSQTSWRNGVRACACTASQHDLAEVLVVPVASGEPDQRERRRQQAAVGQVVDRRHQLLGARSPVTPKITTAHGPAMRGNRLSSLSRSGFCQSSATAVLLTCAQDFFCVELTLGRLEQLAPRLLELVDALVLQHQEDVGEVDADR